MKKLGYALTAILGLASIVGQAPVAAQGGASGVTGAAEASFSSGATFNGVPLRGLTVGQGVVFTKNGSATGQFQAVLLGNSILGALQDVIVEGEIQAGSVAADGSATFSGTATVNGGGTLPAPRVPFVATVSTNRIALTLNATPLPAAIVTAGSITIE